MIMCVCLMQQCFTEMLEGIEKDKKIFITNFLSRGDNVLRRVSKK